MTNQALSSTRTSAAIGCHDREVRVEEAASEHSKGAALANLLCALEGKLSGDLDVQVLVPHPPGNAQKGVL